MKYILFILSVNLIGCASTGVYENIMQPDGSYRIFTSGDCFADYDDVRARSEQEILNLCGGPYVVMSRTYTKNGCHPQFRLIGKCSPK